MLAKFAETNFTRARFRSQRLRLGKREAPSATFNENMMPIRAVNPSLSMAEVAARASGTKRMMEPSPDRLDCDAD